MGEMGLYPCTALDSEHIKRVPSSSDTSGYEDNRHCELQCVQK